MDLPGPDPEAMRWRQQLEAALIVAATSLGNPAAAIKIAEEMVARRVTSSRSRGVVLAMHLLGLTLQHERDQAGTPDPYGPLAARLRDDEVITDLDLDVAWHGRMLNRGLAVGWLPDTTYDDLAIFSQHDPDVLALLARIERRPTPPDTAPENPDE